MQTKRSIGWYLPESVAPTSIAAYAARLLAPELQQLGWELKPLSAVDASKQLLGDPGSHPHSDKKIATPCVCHVEDVLQGVSTVKWHHAHCSVAWFHDFYLKPAAFLNQLQTLRESSQNGREEASPLNATFLHEAMISQQAWFSNSRDFREASRYALEASKTFAYVPLPIADRGAVRHHGRRLRLALCGGAGNEYRTPHLFAALQDMSQAVEIVWLCEEEEKEAIVQLCREFSVNDVVLEVGRTADRWEELVQTCNAAMHCLFSAYGSPEPYLAISMMAGLPALVSPFAAGEDVPQEVVCPIEPGENEIVEIARALERLGDPSVRAELGEHARLYAMELHSPRAVARDVSVLLGDLCVELL